MRKVLETTDLGGYTLYKGNFVCISSLEFQLDPKVWSPGGSDVDATEFWPERFVDLEKNEHVDEAQGANAQQNPCNGKATASLPPPSVGRGPFRSHVEALSIPGLQSKELRERMKSLRPFGGGSALCPGRHLAMYEAIHSLAVVLLNFDIEVDQEALRLNGMPLPDHATTGGMLPDRKLMVRMRRREV